MAEKHQGDEQDDRDDLNHEEFDDSNDDYLQDDFGSSFEPSDRIVETESELLTLKLWICQRKH